MYDALVCHVVTLENWATQGIFWYTTWAWFRRQYAPDYESYEADVAQEETGAGSFDNVPRVLGFI